MNIIMYIIMALLCIGLASNDDRFMNINKPKS